MKTNKPPLALTSATLRSKQPMSHTTPHPSRQISTQLSGTRLLPHPTQLLPPLHTTPISTASITSALNKQPNPERSTDHWVHADLIPTPTVDRPPAPAQSSDFATPVGGTPQQPRSKTPPRSGAPRRNRFTQERPTDPRHGSPVPHSRSTTTPPPFQPFQQQPPPFVQPKRPPPPLPDFTAPTRHTLPHPRHHHSPGHPPTAQQYHHSLPPPQPPTYHHLSRRPGPATTTLAIHTTTNTALAATTSPTRSARLPPRR